MARVRWNTATLPSYVSSMWSNTEDWQNIRKDPALVTLFDQMGGMWVDDLNRELRAAQAARKQPIADGYKHSISRDEDRIRMRIWAFTARAMAHEAKHQSILKLMGHSGFDVNRKGKAQWDWGGNQRRRTSGSSGGRGAGGGGTTTSRPPPRRMDPKREANLRRRLAGVEALAAKGSGATEDERKLAAEKARRLRGELGE